jgi:hypothetical protein
MSIRDYFAAQALVGAMANPGTICGPGQLTNFISANVEQAYAIADAMIAHRSKS